MQLLTTTQAAEFLSHAPGTLIRWRFERVGPPFIKMGKAVRYKLADLEAYLAAHRVDPEAADRENAG